MNKKVVKKNVENWLNTQKLGDIRLGFNNDFEFDGDGSKNDKINIADSVGDYSEFMRLCKELGYNGNLKVKTLCFLHELGHHFTVREFDELENESDEDTRNWLYDLIDNEKGARQDMALKLYYRLPQEKRATEWAVEFATKHPIKSKRLEQALLG